GLPTRRDGRTNPQRAAVPAGSWLFSWCRIASGRAPYGVPHITRKRRIDAGETGRRTGRWVRLRKRPMPRDAFSRARSNPLDDLANVLHLGRRCKTMAYELTPLRKIRRAAKIDGVVFHRFPFDEQPISRRHLDRALQCQTR